jgi:DNA-binding MarR family transcriptional regulator
MVAMTRTSQPMPAATPSAPAVRPSRVPDPVVEAIVDAFEPVLAAQRRVLAAVWQDRSISKLNLHILMLLQGHGPQRMSRLAALAGVALPNLTNIVGRMEELGLVVRESDPRDRRLVVVRATERGRGCVEEIQSVRRDELRRILHTLTPDERRLCLDAMRVMARAATAAEVETADGGTPIPGTA